MRQKDLSVFEKDRREMKVRTELQETKRLYRTAIQLLEQREKELEIALKLKGSVKPISIVHQKAPRTNATAFIVASDWHIEEKVKASTVNGLNEFNLAIAEERAKRFFTNALTLINKESRDVSITTVVLALIGDFISGNIHDELLENTSLRPADAIWTTQSWLYSGIKFLLANTRANLIIPCKAGNHSRITRKIHVSTEDGNSLETNMYRTLAQIFQGQKRVRFVIEEGYHTILDIYGYRVRLHHGHAVKFQGGVGGLSIPLQKAIGQWNKSVPVDLDVLGHWHQLRDFGNAVVNGSLIGYSAYALRIKADYERPQQAFFLIDEKRGKTGSFPILLSNS